MYGVTDSASMLGEVAFLMSVPHPYMAQAHETSSTTLLTLSRAAFDKLLAPYPEAYEQIMNNLLEEYGMDRKGMVQHANTRSMDESVVAERQAMIELIQVRGLHTRWQRLMMFDVFWCLWYLMVSRDCPRIRMPPLAASPC